MLEDTLCYVKQTDYTSFDGSSLDYTIDPTILEIVDMWFSSGGVSYGLYRISVPEMIDRRRVSVPTGEPTKYFAMAGANMMMFYPPPGSGDTLNIYYVPVPVDLAAAADDPSDVAIAGIPTILHRAIAYWAFKEMASYDDDQSSAQGQRYEQNYDNEITRYKKIVRKRGGIRLPRARVNDKNRRDRPFHTNDIYPSSSSF